MSPFDQRAGLGEKDRPSSVARLVRYLFGCVSGPVNLTSTFDATLLTRSYIQRVNISNALVLNLPKDLRLSGVQPNVALTIFFVPYVLFEIPSNILMKRFKPHVWCMSLSTATRTGTHSRLMRSSIRMYPSLWSYYAMPGLWYVICLHDTS